jgi:hypothetical protein
VAEASGATRSLIEARSTELGIRLVRGESVVSSAERALVDSARVEGTAEMVVLGFAAAAAALAAESPERASDLLDELEQARGTHEVIYYARQLPAMVRTALAAGDSALAKRLVEGLEPRYPLDEHALCAARAQLAEAAGEYAAAAALHAEAAARWLEFGNVPERAYALLGQGRCLCALGRPEAEEPLREAREMFASMGYKPAVAKTEVLLEQTAATPAS